MPINSPTGFLDITNATLRTSNLEAQNLKINGGNIYVTVENTSFPTASTINYTNPTSAFTTTSNIEVGNANLFVDTTTSNVGIGTNTPDYTLDVNGSLRAKRLFGSGDGSFSGSGTFNLPFNLDYGSTDKPHIGWEIHLAFGFSGTNYGTFSITGAEDSSGSISGVGEGNSIQLRYAGVNWSDPSSTTYLTANRETVAPTYYAIIRIVQAVETNIATGGSTRWHFQYQCTGCHSSVGTTTYFGSGFFQFPNTARRIKHLRLNCDTGSVSGNYYFVAIS